MRPRPLFYLTLISILFVSLVFYNYSQARRALDSTQPSPLSISLVSFPKTIKSGQSGDFVWQITAAPDQSTTFTTIYWSYLATPSALTQNDSPEAVRYPYSQPDYSAGSFSLPSDFSLRLPFTQPGRVYFRAYAKVGDNHLWTEERQLLVTP